jgi:hypothetical protein
MIEARESGMAIKRLLQMNDWKSWSIVFFFALFFIILIIFSRVDAQLHLPWLMADNSYYYSILLTSQGERPYVDFQPRYTPGMFYLNAAIFKLLGPRMSFVRWGVAIFWLIDLVGLYLVARHFMPRKFAMIAPALALAWGPLDRWVPWASWYSIPPAIFSLYFMIRYIKSGRMRNFFFAALLGGISFFFKQSTGAYAMIFLLVSFGFCGAKGRAFDGSLYSHPNDSKSILTLRIACISFGCFLFPLILMRSEIAVRHVFLHLIPIMSLGIFLIVHVLKNHRTDSNDDLKRVGLGAFCVPLILAGITFLGVTLFWFPVAAEGIGFVDLAKYLLMLRRPEFISAGSELNLTPEISAGTFVPTIICLSIGLIGWILFSRKSVLVRVVTVAAILIVEIGALSILPNVRTHLISEVLHTSAWMVLAMHVVTLSYLWTKMVSGRRKDDVSESLTPFVVMLIFNNFFFLQLFPLNSPTHVLWATNSGFVLAAWFAYMIYRCLPQLDSGRLKATFRKCFRYAFAVTPVMLYFYSSPIFNITVQLAKVGIMIRRDGVNLPSSAVAAGINDPNKKFIFLFQPNKLAEPGIERVDIRLRAEFAYGLNHVISYLKERTGPNDYVFGPNLNFLNYAAEIPSPLSENYFFPGWVSRREEVEMMREIDLLKPRYVIFYTATESIDVLSYNRFRIYFPLFARYLESNYVVEKQIGTFGIARRL